VGLFWTCSTNEAAVSVALEDLKWKIAWFLCLRKMGVSVHSEECTSRRGLFTLLELICGVVIFSLLKSNNLFVRSEPLEWLLLISFLFFVNSFFLVLSGVLSGSGIAGTFYHNVWHFFGLTLYLALGIWTLARDEAPSGDSQKSQYYVSVVLAIIVGIIHGFHGVFTCNGKW